MIPLPRLIAKVLQQLINMYDFPTLHHLLFIPQMQEVRCALISPWTVTCWRPQGSCPWDPFSLLCWMFLQFSMHWPGPSWSSLLLACVALLIHSQCTARPWFLTLYLALASTHDLCSSFLHQLSQTSQHWCLYVDACQIHFSNYLVDIFIQTAFCPLKLKWPELKSPNLFSPDFFTTCLYKGYLFIFANISIIIAVILACIFSICVWFFLFPFESTYSLFLFKLFLASLPLLPVLLSWPSSTRPRWAEVVLTNYFTITAKFLISLLLICHSSFLHCLNNSGLFELSTVWI